METIKFRIYNPIEKRMIESGATPMMLHSFFEITAVLHTRDGMEYQQFTGLRDQNGKEVYDGDCFKTTDKHGYSGNCIAEVKFIEACFAVHIHREDLIQVFKPLHQYLEQYADSTEIIGNIYEGVLTEYDNPDILELCQKELKVSKKDINQAKKLNEK